MKRFSSGFTTAQQQYLVPIGGGHHAFLPPPLPPDIPGDLELMSLLSRADRAIGRLSGIGAVMPNPKILSGPIARREAVQSSRIEGTRASESDLALLGLKSTEVPSDTQEVANYLTALEHLTEEDRRLPVSLPLLLEAHEILLSGVRSGCAQPGRVRTVQNWIGSENAGLAEARYVPPPPERLLDCLSDFERYVHKGDALPPLIKIACLHYQFEAVHPFTDGNGRIGRLLVILLMLEWELLPLPLLDLSSWIEPRRDEYYDLLLRTSTHGDWTGWLRFFLTGLAEQAQAAWRLATRLTQLRDDYRARIVNSERTSARVLHLIDELFAIPAMSIPLVSSLLDVTHRTATQYVERLVEAKILTEHARIGRLRVFLAEELISVNSGRFRAR